MTEPTSTNEVLETETQILEGKVIKLTELANHCIAFWSMMDQTEEGKTATEAEHFRNVEACISFALANFERPVEDNEVFQADLKAMFRRASTDIKLIRRSYRDIPVMLHPAVIPISLIQELLTQHRMKILPKDIPSYGQFVDIYASVVSKA